MFTVPYASTARPTRAGRLLALAVLFGAFINFPSHAQAALTLDQALRAAQAWSRQLVAQDASAAASRQMAIAASQLPDPVLKAGLNSLPVSGADRFSVARDSFTMATVGVAQEFTRADKRKARSGRFDREADLADAGRAVALANLRRDTAIAWLNRLFQERIRETLQTQRSEADLQIEAAQAAYRGGRGTQTDVIAARSALAQIDDRIFQAERQLVTAKTQLARWVGADANQALGPPPPLATLRFDEKSLDGEWSHHPQVALLLRQEALAQAEVDIAQANQRADWSVELTYSQRSSAYSNMVSVNLAIPLQWDRKNRQDREVSSRLALVEQAQAQREESTREHGAQVVGWLQEWRTNRDRLAHYDKALLPLARERTHAATAAYRGGGGLLSAALEARRMEIDTRLDKLRLEMETAGLWAQLNYLLPADHNADPATATEE